MTTPSRRIAALVFSAAAVFGADAALAQATKPAPAPEQKKRFIEFFSVAPGKAVVPARKTAG